MSDRQDLGQPSSTRRLLSLNCVALKSDYWVRFGHLAHPQNVYNTAGLSEIEAAWRMRWRKSQEERQCVREREKEDRQTNREREWERNIRYGAFINWWLSNRINQNISLSKKGCSEDTTSAGEANKHCLVLTVHQCYVLFRIFMQFLPLWLACAYEVSYPAHVVRWELDDVTQELVQSVILVG